MSEKQNMFAVIADLHICADCDGNVSLRIEDPTTGEPKKKGRVEHLALYCERCKKFPDKLKHK